MDKSQHKIRKETISITLDSYILRQINDIINVDKDFSTVSGAITVGMTEFLTRYNLNKDETSMMDILTKMLQTPEGKRAFDKATLDQQDHVKAHNESQDNEAHKIGNNSNKKTKKIVLYENDIPREYILE